MTICLSSIECYAYARGNDGPSGGVTTQPVVTTTPTPSRPSTPQTNPGPPETTGTAGTTASSATSGSDDVEEGDEATTEASGGGSGGGGATYITNNYICNCVHDPEQQFYPTVGTLNSINTSIDAVDVFRDVESAPIAWTPSLNELPNIGETIANTYKYGVLYTGAWDTPSVDNKSDHSIKLDNADERCLFWASWPYAPRIQISSSNEGKNTIAFGVTTDDEGAMNLHGTVLASPESNYVQKTYYDERSGKITNTPYWDKAVPYDEAAENTISSDSESEGSTAATFGARKDKESEVFSLWQYNTWQNVQNVSRTDAQYSAIPSYILQNEQLSEDAKRALNILGYDILYRDEYVTRIHEDRFWSFGYYYDSILDTYLNKDKETVNNPITQDYLVQCLYRVMGQENVETSLFFFCDAKLAVDFSPIAQTLTVSVDKVNEAQNRVDAFVTRCNLDTYWERALSEGLVTNNGETTYLISNLLKAPNVKEVKVGKEKYVVAADEAGDIMTVDTARRQVLTLAEFCELAYKFMSAYGEEVMTDKEQQLLLLTYGSVLPYETVTDSQLEAIKYLMAKGIVESTMAWNDLLNPNTLLTVLMRIKDPSSRLTFKDITLVYDTTLLEQGYYPANMTITTENSFDVVGMTTTTDYSLTDSEWVDFFLKQDNALINGSNAVSTIFHDKSDDKITEPIKTFCLGFKNGNSTYVSESSGKDYTSIRHLGSVVLKDNCTYDRIQVKVSAIYKTNEDGSINFGKFNEKYVNDENCLTINSPDRDDLPNYYRVSAYGGIFSNPTVAATKSGGNTSKDGYVIYYTTDHYNNFSTSWEQVTLSAEDKVNAYDYEALNKIGGSIYSVIRTDQNGYVLEYMKITTDKYTKDPLHFTFDEAGMSIEYIDHARLVGGYAKSLYANPYLSANTQEDPGIIDSLATMEPKYDITFRVKKNRDDTKSSSLEGDVYWGETKIIAKDTPRLILKANGSIDVTYAYERDNYYYYTIHGAYSEQIVRQNIFIDKDKAYVDDTFVGYLERNETILVPTKTLFAFLENSKDAANTFANGHVIEISDDVILLSFDVNEVSDTQNTEGIFNIYLDRARNLIGVNNTIYYIEDEIVFTEVDDTSGDYYINWRAISGWNSGYKVKCDKNGDIELSVRASDGNYAYTTSYVNAYTGVSNVMNYVSFADAEKEEVTGFGISMTSPCTSSTWLVYSSQVDGDYLLVFKANDSMASDSAYARLTDTERAQYALGPTLLNNLLGYTPADNILCAAYALDAANTAVVSTDCTARNKMYRTESGSWVYLTPNISDITTFTDKNAVNKYFKDIDSLFDNLVFDEEAEDERARPRPRDKDLVFALQQIHDAYYTGNLLLPIFNSSDPYSIVWDISSNIIEGCEYGATPAIAMSFAATGDILSSLAEGLQELIAPGSTGDAHTANSIDLKAQSTYPLPVDMDHDAGSPKYNINFAESNINYIPYGIPTVVMNNVKYKTADLVEDYTITYVLMGNYRGSISDGKLRYATTFSANTSEIPEEVTVISMSALRQFVSAQVVPIVQTEKYQELVDKAAEAKLGDAKQPVYVDWDKFSFNALVNDIDSGLTIVLIIALNIIPRIAVFLFLLLIALATIANVKPWKNFCHKYIDPYKLLSFGHKNVDTVDAKWLLISSMIGMVVFLLFMDGTIINVLVWLVRNVGKIITR